MTNHTTLACITIAAGNSSRLGQAKQLLFKDGKSLLANTLELALPFCDPVYCVLGFQWRVMAEEIDQTQVKLLLNPNWQQGMGSSIAAGVEALSEDTQGVLILLCDQWQLDHESIARLVSEWRANPTKIVASEYTDHRRAMTVLGAPAIFPQQYFASLAKLKTSGARNLLMRNPHDVIPVALEAAAFDLDTPDDLAAFRSANPSIEKKFER